jgi:hypothetical protein
VVERLDFLGRDRFALFFSVLYPVRSTSSYVSTVERFVGVRGQLVVLKFVRSNQSGLMCGARIHAEVGHSRKEFS